MSLDANLDNLLGLLDLANTKSVDFQRLLWVRDQKAISFSLDSIASPNPLQEHYDLAFDFVVNNYDIIAKEYNLK